MQKLQLTLAIIKPHAVKNPVAISYIRNVMKNSFIVVRTKRVALEKADACNFYKEHMGKFFFNRLVTFMTSGSVDLHILGHTNAIELWRKLLGPTSVYKGQFVQPYSLRSMFGISDTRNVAHGSGTVALPDWQEKAKDQWVCYEWGGLCPAVGNTTDSPSSALREIKFFFPDFSFYDWHHTDEVRYRKGPIIFNDFFFQHVRKL